MIDVDVLVLGAGPAGEAGAMNASKQGKSVVVVDQRSQVGGNCTHKGTIPSKALREAVKQMIDFNTNPMFREISEPRRLPYPHVLETANRVVSSQVRMRSKFYARNHVTVVHGTASFIDPHRVKVSQEQGDEIYHAKTILIATGSRPYRPEFLDFTNARIYDSDTILEMDHTPRHLIIYGAGVIGCEYASIFNGLGLKIDLINTRDRLLSFLDDEITDALSYYFRDSGVVIRHHEEFSGIEIRSDGLELALKSGKKIKGDALLWCNGRTGNTDELCLEAAGLVADQRGQLTVDQQYRTNVPHIYAAGDVVGWPSLASASYDQGRNAANDFLNRPFNFVDDVPTGIYTIPEISSVGQTERELTDEKVPYEVGQALFKDIARAQITNESVGMLKILFHRDTLEILGVHCFGDQASEIVHIGQAIMKQPGSANSLAFFANTTFNYPTMAEAYRVAAINGLNRVS